MSEFTIERASPSAPEAAALIARHVALMASQSPEESCHVLDGSGLDSPDVAFFLLRQAGPAIGMGALKTLSGGALELKSMHTLVEARGTGAGRAMLEFLLDHARKQGASGVYLETGSTDDFLPARRLYETYGFAECGPFEGYAEDPWSTFMTLDLRGAA
ncbi:GNAT family N-acetyltransferase [Ruegeria pomeroyi]|uniref:GNAT family N-acetyltransferase n=1 Tax=Ruegeria pomeroyi TaxID=89184 RepID=A0A9Q3WKZ2_9RHOB|nr:GNAT family N-acetyltransferase [Ruegeria pomeroyi]MCE8537679.1 GNAT family N-acetyltransferase [Ruegeria pomeroyi]